MLLKDQTELRINKLEKLEMEMIQRLQNTQNVQKEAFENLEKVISGDKWNKWGNWAQSFYFFINYDNKHIMTLHIVMEPLLYQIGYLIISFNNNNYTKFT